MHKLVVFKKLITYTLAQVMTKNVVFEMLEQICLVKVRLDQSFYLGIHVQLATPLENPYSYLYYYK